MKTIVTFDGKACSACHACSVACIDQNDLPTGTGEVCAYRQIQSCEQRVDGGYRFYREMQGCMHCTDAQCMEVCPVGCFTKDIQTGLILPDGTACVGCQLCSEACPYDAIRFNAEGKMHKCDGCIDRIRAGLRAACETICPPQALRFEIK